MPQLTANELVDLVAGTLDDLGPLKFETIAQPLQDYEVVPKWFKKEKVMIQDGRGIQRNLLNKLSGAARHSGLFDTSNANVPDILKQVRVDWIHAETSWAFEYRSDVLMNRGGKAIVDLIEMRRADAMIDLVDEIEEKSWQAPSSTDTVNPFGVPYWIVKDNTTATGAFSGGAPTGHTTVGGVDLTASPNFKNWSANYTNLTKADGIKLLRTSHRKIGFKSPINIPQYRGEKGESYRLYVNEATIQDFEDVGESQNENLGRDVASMDGQMVFNNHPIVWVPNLDTDGNNPIYMINHRTFFPAILKGDNLREMSPIRAPKQPNLFECFVYITYNFVCINRRANAVVYIDN